MHQLRILLIVLGCAVILSSGAWGYVPSEEVSQALDEYESGGSPASDDAMLPQRTRSESRYSSEPLDEDEPSRVDNSSEEPLLARRPHETEMGLETYGYQYLETVEGDHFMDLKGRFFGFFVNHTFRPNQLDPLFSGLMNMFRLELRYARGTLNYTGGVQFGNGDSVPLTMSGVPDWVVEGRAIAGLDMPFHGMTVTPFTGLGIRALEDDASKVTGTFDNHGVQDTISGYRRVSHYYYLPIGVEIEKRFIGDWRARLSMEYDFLMAGMQRSYSPVDITYEGVNYHYDSIKNKQVKGYGMRVALNFKKDIQQFGFFVEPFYRFWDIEDSEVAHMSGPAGYEFVGIAMEPSNTTREIGVKMGVVF
ncbi:MAG: hypothetical protein HQL21_03505 [Candidatus Omnitrophica bacterium]|nr:hypothetical protein [Candidatus Omnitrophota bacterium]